MAPHVFREEGFIAEDKFLTIQRRDKMKDLIRVGQKELIQNLHALSWKSWDANNPNRIVPYGRTFSIFRDRNSGIRYGIYFGDLLPRDFSTLPTGQLECPVSGTEERKNPVFTNWVADHNIFATVSFCIRNGLPQPPTEWRWILPKWVYDLFKFHEGKDIRSSYLSNPNFDYFSVDTESNIYEQENYRDISY